MEKNTEKIIEIFKNINKIPRGSGNEKQISNWIMNWAKSKSFEVQQDQFNNLLIKVPGTGKYKEESYEHGYTLQGHMDMVCQKSSGSHHDFEKDIIDFTIKDGWIVTDGQTTLGADNGIALAMSMYIAESSEIAHPPLELLFTTDEEQGLIGASNVNSTWLQSKNLINIDSEDEGFLTIGCAGNGTTGYTKKYILRSVIPVEMAVLSINVTGGHGGHSGLEIHRNFANANIVIARLLNILRTENELNLVSWNGGTFMNAIPSESNCEILINKSDIKTMQTQIQLFEKVIQSEYKSTEPNLQISSSTKELEGSETYVIQKETDEIIRFVLAIPHGVLGMSEDIKGMVETSNNLAILSFQSGKLYLETMHRSAVSSRLQEVSMRVDAIAKLINADISHIVSTQPWQPNPESALLKKAIDTYQELNNKLPVVEVIHAGLECGVIGTKYPGMEMISIGPTIKGAHTTSERLEISSVESTLNWIYKIIS